MLIIVASNPVLLQPLNQHHKSHGYGVVTLDSPVHMLKEDWANSEEKRIKKWERELIGNQVIRKLKYI